MYLRQLSGDFFLVGLMDSVKDTGYGSLEKGSVWSEAMGREIGSHEAADNNMRKCDGF